MNKTYNVATGIPGDLMAKVVALGLDLTWSRHAKEEAVHDKNGVLPVGSYPKQILVRDWLVVEIEAANGYAPVKLVVRRAADPVRSLVLVLQLESWTEATVKTCWTNLNTDTHKSLDRSKFA